MRKFLFLGAGSASDPGFEQIYSQINLADRGIEIIPTVIESCHGCPGLMSQYSKDMQYLVDGGNRVAGVLEGGLLFGLSSIQATQVTYPIISCPLDLVAFTAFMVPSGHAVISGVGIDRKVGGAYETAQRKKALEIAEKMLNLKEDTVVVKGNGNLEKITKELGNFGIDVSNDGQLVLVYGSQPLNDIEDGSIQIWADSNENLFSGSYFENAERAIANAPNAVQVRGDKNLAAYAAKVLSLQKPDIKEKIEAIAVDKLKSYPVRNLIDELGARSF